MRDPEPYQVVARRFRPKSFSEVVGQDAILQTLASALDSGRIPHAFLFSGSRGVGKTTSARILARALNCARGPSANPCGECQPCRAILAGSNPDVIEIDAASHNMVDDIRELRDRVAFASMGSRYKVYILDEAHMLTRSAFNALLKTLEEPPPNVVFVLATTELHKVPETIRSRCQVLLFRRVSDAEIKQRLTRICELEGVAIDAAILDAIVADCRGGMRDAETALERVLPLAKARGTGFDLAAFRALFDRIGPDAALAAVESLLRGEARAALHFAAEVVRAGADEREVLGDLVELLRAILLLKLDGPDSGLVTQPGVLRDRLVALAQGADTARLDAMLQAGLNGRERIRRLEDRRVVLELALLRMAQAGTLPTLADLLASARTGGLRADAPAGGAPAQPAAAAVAPAGPAAGSGDLRARLLQRLQQDRPLLAATIELSELAGPDAAGVVTLRILTDKKMHHDRLAAEPLRKELEKRIAEVAGREVKLVVATAAAAAAAPPVATPAAPAGAGGAAAAPRTEPSERVRRLAERFDGKIVEVNDRPPN